MTVWVSPSPSRHQTKIVRRLKTCWPVTIRAAYVHPRGQQETDCTAVDNSQCRHCEFSIFRIPIIGQTWWGHAACASALKLEYFESVGDVQSQCLCSWKEDRRRHKGDMSIWLCCMLPLLHFSSGLMRLWLWLYWLPTRVWSDIIFAYVPLLTLLGI